MQHKIRLLKIVVTLLVLIWGVWQLHGVTFSEGFSRVSGDLGDSRLNNLLIEHSHRFISGEWPGTYWDLPWMFFPFQKGLALSDVMTGNVLIYSPLRWLGLDPIGAYQGWFVICSLFNFGSFLTFMRIARFPWWPSVVASFLFAFSLPRNAFLMHPQLLPQFPTIFSLSCLLLYFRSPIENRLRPVWLVLAAFWFAFQFWVGFYLWWFFFFSILLALIFLVLQPRLCTALVKDIFSHPLAWLAAGVVAVILLAPLGKEYLSMQEIMGRRDFDGIRGYLPKEASYFYPPIDSYFYSFLHARNSQLSHETRMFLGLGILGALLVSPVLAWLEARKNESGNQLINWRFAILSVLIFVAIVYLSLLRPGGYSLWEYVYRFVPGAGALRAVGRIVLLLLIPGALLVAYCLNRLHLIRSKSALIASGVLGLLIIGEQTAFNTYAFKREDHEKRLTEITRLYEHQTALSKTCEVFYYKNGGPDFAVHLDSMWLSLMQNVPTINGYSGNSPQVWGELGLNEPSSALGENIRKWLSINKSTARVCILDGTASVSHLN